MRLALLFVLLTACSPALDAPEPVVDMTDRIRVTSPLPGDAISTPLTITGQARGNYFFEATFPIEIVDEDGEVIVNSYATAEGEWMTEDFVPFSVTLHTELPTSGNGKILLKRQNASGLPEFDETFEVPIQFDAPKNDPQALEQVPSEISLTHFGSMRLEGTDFVIGDVLARKDAYTRYTITYRSNGLLISGILNIPHGDGPFPLVVTNHGYIDRSVYTNGRGLKREQDYLARQGYVVLHPDYRGHAFSDPSPLPDDTAIYDAGIEYSMDVLNGVYALRDLNDPRIDAKNVAMLGHSMGGGITLNIATMYPDIIKAIVLYAPVHTDAWENFARWRRMRAEGTRTTDAFGTRQTDPKFWDKISSLAYLDNLSAPVLLFQGTIDADVPAKWSDFLDATLQEKNKDITYIVYEGEGHEFISQFSNFMQQTKAFLSQHL